MIHIIFTAIFVATAIAQPTKDKEMQFQSEYSVPQVTESICPNLLSRAVIRTIISVLPSREDLIKQLRFYQRTGQMVARSDTAYDQAEWHAGFKKCPLTSHCGAMVWFLQRRYGGRAVLKAYRADDGDEFWHMHLEDVPFLTEDGRFGTVDVDLTKTQLDDVVDDLKPVGDTIRYRGKTFRHSSEMVYNRNYLWDRDLVTPPHPRLELFARRLEFGFGF